MATIIARYTNRKVCSSTEGILAFESKERLRTCFETGELYQATVEEGTCFIELKTLHESDGTVFTTGLCRKFDGVTFENLGRPRSIMDFYPGTGSPDFQVELEFKNEEFEKGYKLRKKIRSAKWFVRISNFIRLTWNMWNGKYY